MIRMVCIDLDGTLLRSDKSVSERTIRALARCRARGVRILIATARPLRTARPCLERIEPDALACHNGAVLRVGGVPAGESHAVPEADAHRILSACARNWPQMRISAEIDDRLHANFDVSALWGPIAFVPADFDPPPAGDADKLIFEIIEAQQEEAIKAMLTPALYAQRIDGRLLMVMHAHATKLRAIQEMGARWGIGLEETAAFGDDRNDLEMIARCGWGVAMGNALPEVKAVASLVTDENDADGVAACLERWLAEGRTGASAGEAGEVGPIGESTGEADEIRRVDGSSGEADEVWRIDAATVIRREVGDRRAHLPLLLLADPCEDMIDRYLPYGDMFVIERDGTIVGEAVVVPVSREVCELKSLAVDPAMQGKGLGSGLIRELFALFADRYASMAVGTSDDGVAFYERLGFVRCGVRSRFFVDNYPEPIIENGRQCVDMQMLERKLMLVDADPNA